MVGLGKVNVGLVRREMKILLEFRLILPLRESRGAEGVVVFGVVLLMVIWMSEHTEGCPTQEYP